MVSDPEDKWSYGRSVGAAPAAADNIDSPVSDPWSGEPNASVPPGETIRLSTGRWSSSRLIGDDATATGVPAPRPAPATNGFDADAEDDDFGSEFFDNAPAVGYEDATAGVYRDFGPQKARNSVVEEPEPFNVVDDEDRGSSVSGGAKNAIEWAVVLVGAVLLALILRAVLLQAFWIPSPSMESTLEIRDRVLVNKMSYRLHDINRGDVVVFRRTDEEIATNPDLPRDVIKRVIALPGETIEIANNTVMIDGAILVEPYLDEGIITEDFGPEVVPPDHVFVMGDNRGQSLDSRFETGPVAEDRVVGRAFFLFWPLGRMGSL